MTGKTHLAAGIVTGEAILLTGQTTEYTTALIAVAAAVVGSLLPDIDHPQSMLSSSNGATKAISSSVSAVTQHRGFTHTPVFVAAITFAVQYLLKGKLEFATIMAMGLCAGMLSHLLLDSMNEKGVMWLWPLWRRPIHIATIRTGSKVEDVFCLALKLLATVGVAAVLYKLVLQQYFSGFFSYWG